jgi:hypothetical protein
MKLQAYPGCLFMMLAFYSFGQPAQENSEELEKRNGFKTIKLAEHIDSVAGATFKKDIKEKNEFPAKLYSIKDVSLNMIGEVKVSNVEVKTYRDLVYEIEVTTEKDQRLMKGMEKALGKAIYNIRTEAYHWRANSLSLTFIGNKNTITLIYRSYPVFKMMYADKGKKIETIAEDF